MNQVPQMNRMCMRVYKSTISLFLHSVHQSGQSNFFRAAEKWREKSMRVGRRVAQRSIDDSFVDLETSRFMRLHTGCEKKRVLVRNDRCRRTREREIFFLINRTAGEKICSRVKFLLKLGGGNGYS